jgi:hypothetical protein
MLVLVLTIVLIVALIGAVPIWPHSRDWGYVPVGGVSVIILILLALLLTGRV